MTPHQPRRHCRRCDRRATLRELGQRGFCPQCRDHLNADIKARCVRAAKRYLKGMTRRDAAAAEGISLSTFEGYCNRHDVTLVRRLSPEQQAGRSWKLSAETRRRQQAARRKTVQSLVDVPLPVSKRCNGPCGRVLPGGEHGAFYVLKGKATSADGRRSRALSSLCKECSRARTRAYRASLPVEIRRQRDREKDRRFREKHGDEYVREIGRFSKQKKREEAGRDRAWVKGELGKKSQAIQNDVKLALAPFQDWIRERARYYSDINDEWMMGYDRPDAMLGIGALANACHISDRTLRRFLDGGAVSQGKWRPVTHVPLGTVDSCLTNEGSTYLFELYDEDHYVHTADKELLTAA